MRYVTWYRHMTWYIYSIHVQKQVKNEKKTVTASIGTHNLWILDPEPWIPPAGKKILIFEINNVALRHVIRFEL